MYVWIRDGLLEARSCWVAGNVVAMTIEVVRIENAIRYLSGGVIVIVMQSVEVQRMTERRSVRLNSTRSTPYVVMHETVNETVRKPRAKRCANRGRKTVL